MHQKSYPDDYAQNQRAIVMNWQKIRQELKVQPEFPAGLRYFLWELFRERV